MSLNVAIVLILSGGWLFSKIFQKINLSAVLGMIVFGIFCSIFLSSATPKILWEIAPFLKSFALMVILLRAGLGIRKENLKKAGMPALLMTFVPCLFEGTALLFTFRLLFGFKWLIAGLTGFMLSAVSPAVIVPNMLDLKENSYGSKNEVPMIVLAGASVDPVVAITIFTAFLSLSLKNNINLFKSVVSIPFSIILGISLGLLFGHLLVNFLKRHHEKIRSTEKTLIMLTAAMLLVEVGNSIHVASLLGVMTVGFIMLQKSERIANELSLKLSKIWIFSEIILFVLVGYSIDVNVAINVGLKGLLAISIGLFFRSIGVLAATLFSSLNLKERLFCVIANIPKATVQAALGSVALNNGLKEGKLILAIAVLSILFTAPIGLIGIRNFGKKLLNIDFAHNVNLDMDS